MSGPHVEAVILSHNGWRVTLACLESMAHLDYPNVRVVVCDNGSTDDSALRVDDWIAARAAVGDPRFEQMRTGANLGFAGGNNVAVRSILETTDARYVWLLNNDMTVQSGALTHLVATAEADAMLAAVGATMLRFDRPDVVQEVGGGRLSWWPGLIYANDGDLTREQAAQAGPRRLDYVSGGCMLMRRSALERVGLLDEAFFLYGEDADWCLRARDLGMTVGYSRAAEVWHKGSASVGDRSAFQDFHMVRSTFVLARKHTPQRMIPAIAHGLFRFVLPKVVGGEWTRLRAVARGYLSYRRYVSSTVRSG